MARRRPRGNTGHLYDGPPHLKPIDEQEALFIEEYLKCLDAPTAALKAGYSKSVAFGGAYGWVRDPEHCPDKPQVAFIIEREIAARAKKNALTADRLFQEIARLAFSDIRNLYDETGDLISPKDLSDDAAAAISAIDVEERTEGRGEDARSYRVKKVRQYDKVASITTAARLLGLLRDRSGGGDGSGGAPESSGPPALRVVLKPPAGTEVPPGFRGLVSGE